MCDLDKPGAFLFETFTLKTYRLFGTQMVLYMHEMEFS